MSLIRHSSIAVCATIFSALSLSSCIADEPLNAECDITGVDSVWLATMGDALIGEPVLTDYAVNFNIKRGTDRTALAPVFTLTEGATLTMTDDGVEVPANGATRNFSTPQKYTTHSENGMWQKEYTVKFDYPLALSLLSFEQYEMDGTGRYQQWYEVDTLDIENPKRPYWSSGNAGYALCPVWKTTGVFPTMADADGWKGKCVKLVTCNAGSFGKMFKMPIAAGSIFIGEFDATKATSKPRQATKFGRQLLAGRVPKRLEGYYKYSVGETFTNANKDVLPERRDTADIYAVVYECDPDHFEALDGDNVLTSDRIVLLARIAEPGEPQEWTKFDIPFEPQNGKTIDYDRLNKDGYAITVVATSSRQGAYFEGAIGSTLYIDEIQIVWE